MALVVKDRVKETSTTSGTGTLTLAGASAGFQSFSVIGNGNTTYYAIVDPIANTWEVGVGTYSSTGPTLSRDTVLESSNSGSLVSFAANAKDVFVTYPAERSVDTDSSQSLSNKTLVDPLLSLSGSNGTSGQVPVSQGAGLPPVWGSASGGSSVSVSSTAPTSPSSGALWYDTSNGVMLVYYNSQWIEDYQSQLSNAISVPDMDGGTASTTSWTYSINCGAAT